MPTLDNGTTEIVTKRTYQPGVYNTPVYTLQVGQKNLLVRADRNGWKDIGGDVVEMITYISFDGGATKQLLIGFTAPGGDIVNPWTGQIEPYSYAGFELRNPDLPNRQLTGVCTIYQRINTAVTFTVS